MFLLMSNRTQSASAPSNRQVIAYHDAAHAVAGFYFGAAPDDLVLQDACRGPAQIGDVAAWAPYATASQLRAAIVVLLAGRAAELQLVGDGSSAQLVDRG